MTENKMPKTLQNSIILVGIKHCGKSTQGKALAKHFNCLFFDTDDLIEQTTGKTPRQIFQEQGQEGFMNAEYQACQTLAEKKLPAVIATGGGICNNQKAVETLKKLGGTIIFLEAEEKTAADRIVREAVFENGNLTNIPAYIAKKNPHTLQDVRTIFHEFYEQRCKQYKKIADVVANVAAVPITENTQHILQLLAATSAAT